MALPFTTDQFFEIFALYNASVWPSQIVLSALAILSIILMFRLGSLGGTSGRIISLILALLWLWMGGVYHLTFFRRINPAAWVFGLSFAFEGLLIAWTGLVRGRIQFDSSRGTSKWIGGALVVAGVALYPVTGYLLGQRYPAFPTFGLPCPTTIFSIGVFALAKYDTPKVVLIVPVLWTFIGSYAAYSLGVIEDLMLVPAGIAGAWMIIRSTQDQI